MCITNIYVDRYPDGREVEFRKLSLCQYGMPGRPCPTHSTLENPIRTIGVGEPTTQYMMTQAIYPSTPPRSTGGSHHRHHSGSSHRHTSVSSNSEDGHRHRHKTPKATRTHRKERIVIVDAPPTPRTPPQTYPQTFTAPSSPNPPFGASPRNRPIIVDERTIRSSRRSSSVPRVLPIPPISSSSGTRPIPIPQRSSRPAWDTPSSSHTSFDLRAERERDEAHRARLAAARRLAEHDEEIRRRPAVPIVPRQQRPAYPRPIVENSQALSSMMGGLSINTNTEPSRRRLSTRVEAAEAEAMQQRLRERQMPRRRFSVGPGHRRSRVIYDDAVYRWE